mgnify:FL=1
MINPTQLQEQEDGAALLVVTALLVGSARAIEAGRRRHGDAGIAAALPVLQTAALDTQLRRRVKQADLDLDDLREEIAEAIGADVPPLEQLTRVSWQSALMVAFVGLAASTIIGMLVDVGIETIFETLADCRWGLVLLALVAAAATNYTDAVSVAAVAPKPVPAGITTVELFAIGFVNLAAPSAAGRVATNARYFQKFGVGMVAATTIGAVTGLLGFVVQAILIILSILAGKGSIDLSQLEGDGGALRLIVLAVLLAGIAVVAVLVVPRWRHWAWERIREPLSRIGAALRTVRNPRAAGKALGAAFGTELLYASGLTLCVLAVGGSVSLGEAIFINVSVSLFAGLMPVPGGVGVSEAGLTAGLTAVGVPSEIAVSAVIVYRLVSYYLPPIWGDFYAVAHPSRLPLMGTPGGRHILLTGRCQPLHARIRMGVSAIPRWL